ncbi:MAG: hypothetical protein EZS28_005273 [Streblomastix strix]|uniref:NrS-1 polymerase-like helicase domain-containing protein n=1 Tax=Streblomastix strix TaxID=222440 RepID=A0A5J4WWL3_9EUKA|nr:MAG: hypothetical protein EZS28_005273 [Streblomastix strix]
MATYELSNDKSIQQTNVKSITLKKGLKRKYTRNSKTDDKEKAIIDQMINEQTTEQINEQTNEQTNELVIEQTIEQTTEPSQRQIIEEEYVQSIHDLINSEGDHETRLVIQQLAYVDGLKNLDIHNYPQPINMEISILSIFCGLYGISSESIRAEGIGNIRKFNKLSAKADKNYGQAVSNGERKPNPWIFTKILRYHNNDYYEQTLKQLLKKSYELKKQQQITNVLKSIEKYEIDPKDLFILKDILDKASNGEYANQIELIAQNLQKILKVAACQNGSCYSAKNITDIDEFVGNFNSVIESRMIAIPNELKNSGEQKPSNMNAMKSIITEGSFRIDEKYVPKHEAENVVNLIIVTNNLFPIKIENSDRRYVGCKCNPVHRGDLEHFTNLDISSFNRRDIPMTEEKKDIIRASKSPVDDVIIKHFKVFQVGVTTPVAESWKPEPLFRRAMLGIVEKLIKLSMCPWCPWWLGLQISIVLWRFRTLAIIDNMDTWINYIESLAQKTN